MPTKTNPTTVLTCRDFGDLVSPYGHTRHDVRDQPCDCHRQEDLSGCDDPVPCQLPEIVFVNPNVRIEICCRCFMQICASFEPRDLASEEFWPMRALEGLRERMHRRARRKVFTPDAVAIALRRAS